MRAKSDVTVLKTKMTGDRSVTHVNDIVDARGRTIIYFNVAANAWALPGNDFTQNRDVAERVANQIQAAHVAHRLKRAYS